MKYREFSILSVCLLIFFLIACSDDDAENKVVSWQENGYIDMKFSYQDSDVKRIVVLYNKSLEALTAQVRIYTPQELEDYNKKNGTNYHLIPEGTYELSKTAVTFNSGEKSQELEVTIHSEKLFDIVRGDTETKQYVLPLKVDNLPVTNNTDGIYVMNMTYPVIRLTEPAKLRLMKESDEIPLTAYTYEGTEATAPVVNKGNVSLDVTVADNAEAWLQAYNKENETEYRLLPAGAYTLGKLMGEEGEEQATTTIRISRSLTSGGTLEYDSYVLPIQLKGKDAHVALDHNISVVSVVNTNTYDDIGREYDDGENLVFHVKLAIDEEGFAMMDNDMAFFKKYLGEQWDAINHRFNALDKKGILNRNYIFVPDLEDIIVYKYKNNDSHWSVAKDYEDRIDVNKFQLTVSYDFVQQDGEGGGGFGGNCPEGINNIMVTCYSKTKEDIQKYAGTEALSEESIVHELGHYRGLIDTYWCEISAVNNKVNGKSFAPERGNMMGACYSPLEEVEWSEYEMYVINTTAAGGKNVDIHSTVRNYFPDEAEFQVTENGKPVEGFTLNIYRKDYTGSKIEKLYKTYTQPQGSSIKLNATVPLFWEYSQWYESYPHTYNRLLLIEVVSTKTGKKVYQFLPVYEVHKQGLLDKYLNKITGKSVFKMAIDIK